MAIGRSLCGCSERSEPEVVSSSNAPPADIGNWGLLQVFHESGRLLGQHYGVFLPIIFICILPASLIKVMHTQFVPADYLPSDDTQASTDDQAAESTVFKYLGIFFWGLVFALPQFFIVLGAAVMFSFLTNMIYSDGRGESTAWCRESLRESINLALFIKDVETENPVLRTTTTERSLYARFRRNSKGKRLRALAAIVACVTAYSVISTTGVNFTPKAIAEMGLPPWTLIVFTLLITFFMTVATTYLILVHLVLFIWLCSPTGLNEVSYSVI